MNVFDTRLLTASLVESEQESRERERRRGREGENFWLNMSMEPSYQLALLPSAFSVASYAPGHPEQTRGKIGPG